MQSTFMKIKTTTMTRSRLIRPLTSGLLGMTLLLPATFFMLTLLARICFGTKSMYYYFSRHLISLLFTRHR
jgi:hypothetical protein